MENLRGGTSFGKGTDNTLPGFVQTCVGDLTLPGQYLPQAKVGLENPYGIGAHNRRADVIESVSRRHKGGYGLIAQTRKLREDRVLIAEPPESISEQDDGRRGQPFLRQSPAVDFTQRKVNFQRRSSLDLA